MNTLVSVGLGREHFEDGCVKKTVTIVNVGLLFMYLEVDIIYLHIQKAFDKVPHQRMLLKLKARRSGDGIIDWIEKWLTDRRHYVVVDGEVSY